MTPAPNSTALTVHRLLLDDPDVLERALVRPGGGGLDRIGRLSPAARRAVGDEVTSAIAGLLAIDLADVLVQGWRRHTALTAAARRSAGAPGTVEVVDLATHTVRFGYEPSVELRLDGVAVARIDVALSLAIEVTGLAATVRDGAIMALSGGRCAVTGRLSIQGSDVASRTMSFDPGLALRLGSGLQLTRPIVTAA